MLIKKKTNKDISSKKPCELLNESTMQLDYLCIYKIDVLEETFI
jgi:hypothetical protein